MKATFDIYDLFKIIWKHAWVVVASVVVCLGGLFIYNGRPTDTQYQADTQILVYPTTQNSINFATMSDLVQSKGVINKAIKTYKHEATGDTDSDVKYSDMKELLTTTGNGNSQVITISINQDSKRDTKLLSKAVADSFIDKAKKVLPVHIASIISAPTLKAAEFTSISTRKLVVFGVGGGLFLGIVLAFVIEVTEQLRKRSSKQRK